MERRLWALVMMLLLLAGCGQAEVPKPPVEEKAEVPAETEGPGEDGSIQTAVLEGEALSPDGRFLARVEGYSGGITVYPAGWEPDPGIHVPAGW